MSITQNRKYLVFSFLIVFLITLPFFILGLIGYRINLSSSVDGYFWHLDKSKAPVVGDYVLVCPDEFFPRYRLFYGRVDPGKCGGYVPLIKRLIAQDGDLVEITAEGIFVNDIYIDNSKPLTGLPKVEPFIFSDRLQAGHVIVIGDSFDSLDSRYFGPFDSYYVVGVAKKIFTHP